MLFPTILTLLITSYVVSEQQFEMKPHSNGKQKSVYKRNGVIERLKLYKTHVDNFVPELYKKQTYHVDEPHSRNRQRRSNFFGNRLTQQDCHFPKVKKPIPAQTYTVFNITDVFYGEEKMKNGVYTVWPTYTRKPFRLHFPDRESQEDFAESDAQENSSPSDYYLSSSGIKANETGENNQTASKSEIGLSINAFYSLSCSMVLLFSNKYYRENI
ncbi:hypothetical protein HW555_000704 [Spodoptera exigua]|uniref:Uncharacterized protein n=1 Tax=Spodoptera exigua TaxID=7107 RepID=A0A835GU90_SPOEX|nr:hypothetical protein HW555_000704 [Spodoptera exigua]